MKRYYSNKAKDNSEFYVGSAIYQTDTTVGNPTLSQLKYIMTNEGRLSQQKDGYFAHEYMLKDHLGNTRVLFGDYNRNDSIEASEVLQQAHYYPFGMAFTGLDLDADTNKFLYNGKELQTDGGLGWYDYGARMYDASLGRWHCTDPLAEWHLSQSPYNYCINNPIYYIDPDGMRISPEDRQRRREARREARRNGWDFKSWRGKGENKGMRFWSVTKTSNSAEEDYVLGSATATTKVYSAERYDQENGSTWTMQDLGAFPVKTTSRFWDGSEPIDLLMALFGSINKKIKRTPKKQKNIFEKTKTVTKQAENINKINETLKSDKEIVEEGTGPTGKMTWSQKLHNKRLLKETYPGDSIYNWYNEYGELDTVIRGSSNIDGKGNAGVIPIN